MNVQLVEELPGLTRVTLSGMLDLTGVGEVETMFFATTVGRSANTIVDVSELSFISSLGMGMLLSAARGLKRKGARLVLLNPQPDVALALGVARLTELLPMARDEAEAERLLAS